MPGYALLEFTEDHVFYSGIKDYAVYRQPRADFKTASNTRHVATVDSFCNTVVADPGGGYVLVEKPNYVSLEEEIVRFDLDDSLYFGLPNSLFSWYNGLVRQEEDSLEAEISEILGSGNIAWSSEACPDTTYELVGVKNPYAEEYIVLERTYERGKGTLCSIFVMNAEDGDLDLLREGLGGWTDYKQKRRLIAWFP
jgi:hypothetical protein